MLEIQAERNTNNVHGDIVDIDADFLSIMSNGLPDTPLTRYFLQSIDGCTYKDNKTVYNRFGESFMAFNLSSGCKAAIMVSNTTYSIDLLTVGYNARDEIIKHCTSGSIVIHDIDRTIAHDFDSNGFVCTKPIDVLIYSHHFTRLDDLNAYLNDID